MILIKNPRSFNAMFFVALMLSVFYISSASAASFELTGLDPSEDVTLGSNEKLYINVSYVSNDPLRFLASAMLNGEKREVGAIMSPAALHASGKSNALLWIAFANPTHIDEVVVTAYDEGWNSHMTASAVTNVRWNGALVELPREPAAWVLELQKKERLKRDYLFDPEPNQPEPASDIIFMLAILSIPIYVFLQVRMLRRYTQRWRELATVPLITALPLVAYALWVGIGFNLWLWPPFIMYFVLFANGYLLMLWGVKKLKE